uniref:MADS-box domain-containing protein n=1 Tax=Fagus sylvatica TaxID=28930 RepID=A0A2N9J8T0_FAGSY
MTMVKKKPSIGRQKIPIAKIPKKNHLQVTFSKRRSGLFKKASELCTLCGAEIAIIVFSPAEKAFSFGHPDVESILHRYLTRNPPPETSAHQIVEAHRNANVRELNIHLTQILNQLEAEKKRGEALDQIRKASRRQFWWEAPLDELGLHELEQLRVSMEDLKKNVEKQANKILIGSTTNPSPFLGVNSFGSADFFEIKPPEFNATSTMSNVYNFGYGNGLF